MTKILFLISIFSGVLMANVLIGPRVPKHYFTSEGAGETDSGPGIDPWETGSYDIALLEAQIGNYNIIQYSSVLPKNVIKCEYKDLQGFLRHGAVLETIMSQINGQQGDYLCAGIITAHVKDSITGKRLGGYACEYKGHLSVEEAKELLLKTMKRLVERRTPPSQAVELYDIDYIIKDLVVVKKYGTVLVCLGFVTFEIRY